MPTKRPQLSNGNYYHVYNRGVDKRDIFSDKRDWYRFIHDLYEFNDVHDVLHLARLSHDEQLLQRLPYRPQKKRILLVDIIAFALMPNHYHILLRQRSEGGISLFMKKLGAGYTGYFNERYDRSGSLFQGRYKVKLVNQDSYLRHVVNYIHANPIPLLKFGSQLAEYRWSSFQDYIGQKNFPSIVNWQAVERLAISRGEEHTKHVLALANRKFSPHIAPFVFEE